MRPRTKSPASADSNVEPRSRPPQHVLMAVSKAPLIGPMDRSTTSFADDGGPLRRSDASASYDAKIATTQSIRSICKSSASTKSKLPAPHFEYQLRDGGIKAMMPPPTTTNWFPEINPSSPWQYRHPQQFHHVPTAARFWIWTPPDSVTNRFPAPIAPVRWPSLTHVSDRRR